MTRRGNTLLGLGLILTVTASLYFTIKSPHFQFFGHLTDRVQTTDRVVALTFDDGPTPQDTPLILSELRKFGVPATFFLIGQQIEKFPNEAKMIVDAGHQIGNHSYSHRRMILTPLGEVESEITRTNDLLRKAGYEGEIRFRPPYGKKFLTLPWYLARHDIETVTWTVAPEGQGAEDSRTLTRQVLAQTRPGSIILLHPMNGRKQTQQALAPIVRGLQAEGYRLVTVNELLKQRGR